MSVEKQLEQYKKRDLKASYYDRVLRRRSSLHWKVFCRHHYLQESNANMGPKIDYLPSSTSLDLYLSLPALTTRKIVHGDKSEVLPDDDSNLSCHEWVKKRKELKKKLDKLDFNISWLKRKPERTGLEDRVLARMRGDGDSLSSGYNKDSQEIQHLDSFESSASIASFVTAAIDKIASAILENKLLLNLFNNCGSERISYDQCEHGLTELAEVISLSSVDKEALTKYYFKEKKESKLFYLALLQAVRDVEERIPLPLSTEDKQEIDGEDEISPPSRVHFAEESPPTPTCAQRGIEMRQIRIKDCEATIKAAKTYNLPVEHHIIERGLLHPGDIEKPSLPSFKIRQPSNTLSKNFWCKMKRKRSKSIKVKKSGYSRKKLRNTSDISKKEHDSESETTDQDLSGYKNVSPLPDLPSQNISSCHNLFSTRDHDLLSEQNRPSSEEKSIHGIDQTIAEILSEQQEVFEFDAIKFPELENALNDITKVIQHNRKKLFSEKLYENEQIGQKEANKQDSKLPQIKLTHRPPKQSRKPKEILHHSTGSSGTTRFGPSTNGLMSDSRRNFNLNTEYDAITKLKLSKQKKNASKFRNKIQSSSPDGNDDGALPPKEKSSLKLPKLDYHHSKSTPNKRADANAFWPGHDVDIRLCMSPDDMTINEDVVNYLKRSSQTNSVPLYRPHGTVCLIGGAASVESDGVAIIDIQRRNGDS